LVVPSTSKSPLKSTFPLAVIVPETFIAPVLICNADAVPSPSSIDLSVPSTPLVSILSRSG